MCSGKMRILMKVIFAKKIFWRGWKSLYSLALTSFRMYKVRGPNLVSMPNFVPRYIRDM